MKKKKNKGKLVVKKSNRLDYIKYVSFYTFLSAFIVASLLFISSSFKDDAVRMTGVKHEATMVLPEASIDVEIVDTKEEVERGLSGRLSIGEKEGMLFVFPEMGKYSFWMKEMNFPIDIIWISDEGRVVYIKENATPDSYPKKTFMNDAFAKYVLEMKTGSASKYGLYLGTSVTLPESVKK
jgi:uncharacterized membrane protein (UPF0127 family)